MPCFDINETLARHLATGGGAAFLLRSKAHKDRGGLSRPSMVRPAHSTSRAVCECVRIEPSLACTAVRCCSGSVRRIRISQNYICSPA